MHRNCHDCEDSFPRRIVTGVMSTMSTTSTKRDFPILKKSVSSHKLYAQSKYIPRQALFVNTPIPPCISGYCVNLTSRKCLPVLLGVGSCTQNPSSHQTLFTQSSEEEFAQGSSTRLRLSHSLPRLKRLNSILPSSRSGSS